MICALLFAVTVPTWVAVLGVIAMEHGRIGHRYILGGESISLKKILKLMATISGRRSLAIPVPGKMAEAAAATLEFIADHVTRKPPSGGSRNWLPATTFHSIPSLS